MRKFVIILFAMLPMAIFPQSSSKTALLLIDIQDFYFPGGNSALVEPEAAAEKAAIQLKSFREKGQLVIHVRHKYEPGGSIHKLVAPLDTEKVITKNEVNSFKDTDLLAYLKENKIESLVVIGMQTHMCLEGGVRAAHDYGFDCIVVEDACATKDLKFNDQIIPAKQVHLSTLSTLGAYAKIVDLETYFTDNK